MKISLFREREREGEACIMYVGALCDYYFMSLWVMGYGLWVYGRYRLIEKLENAKEIFCTTF